jgi:hypothetical protein
MTRAKAAILATAVWASGFVALGALANTYGGAPQAVVSSHRVSKTLDAHAPIARLTDEVVRMPTVEIVGHRPAPVVAVAVAAQPRHRDISEMTCSAWRELQQGSNGVRVCE